MNTNLQHISVSLDSTFEDLLVTMSRPVRPGSGSGFAVIENKDGRVIGVVTDADIRRFIEANGHLPEELKDVIRRDFACLTAPIDSDSIGSRLQILMMERGWHSGLPVRHIPLLDESGSLLDVIDAFEYREKIESFRDYVAVVGLGYVGLTTLAAIARTGRVVFGIDSDRSHISDLRIAKSRLDEPGLEDILRSRLAKNISFESDFRKIRRESGRRLVFIICLPTPLSRDKDTLEVSLIREFLTDLGPNIKPGDAIVMRSTVPVGFGREAVALLEGVTKLEVGSDFHYVSAPERTVEGNAINEIAALPQIVAGATDVCLQFGKRLFSTIAKVTLECTSLEVAETAKIAGNGYRDFSFAFANFLAMFSAEHGIEASEVIQVSNYGYPRSSIPKPSPGVGGSCLTKDPFLLRLAGAKDDSPVVRAREFNETMPFKVVRLVETNFVNLIELDVVAVGLAFKGEPENRDLRNSTPLEIVSQLKERCKSMSLVDLAIPEGTHVQGIPTVSVDSLQRTDLVLLLNNHLGNFEALRRLSSLNSSDPLRIFDPWELVSEDFLRKESAAKRVEYLTLSKLSIWLNGTRFDK